MDSWRTDSKILADSDLVAVFLASPMRYGLSFQSVGMEASGSGSFSSSQSVVSRSSNFSLSVLA